MRTWLFLVVVMLLSCNSQNGASCEEYSNEELCQQEKGIVINSVVADIVKDSINLSRSY